MLAPSEVAEGLSEFKAKDLSFKMMTVQLITVVVIEKGAVGVNGRDWR